MAALAEAVPDGRAPGPQEREQLATRPQREVTSRSSELDHLLGALAGQNRDPVQPPSAAWMSGGQEAPA